VEIMSNRLAGQNSPYLLQHKDNPVQWYPWGPEAFSTAERLDRPIFLSIGYSTCHWCHVMARESFENPDTASLLNAGFISIKVDREERPDIDGTYMSACQLMTGSGGWPLTIIMTPQKEPFFAATYIPRETRHGLLGLNDLLPRLSNLWLNERGKVEEVAVNIAQTLRESARINTSGEPGQPLLEEAFNHLFQAFDHLQGGFGIAPKFPVPHNLAFLLRWWKRTGSEDALMMVEKTLQAMRRGGIFDQLGFGFHRYSTDRAWLIPHFEKMLYDQTLMSIVCLEAYQATRDPQYAGMAEETLEYMQRGLGSEDNCFYSGEDADSDGQEGKFYLWNLSEVNSLLGSKDAALAASIYGLLPAGNYHSEHESGAADMNILHLPQPLSEAAASLSMDQHDLATKLEAIRRRLYQARQARVRPFRDEKVLADWNGLALAALARAGRVLGRKSYLEGARNLAEFISRSMRTPEGRLWHCFINGSPSVPGNLDDYAFVAWGFIEIYEAEFSPSHLKTAMEITGEMLKHFWDVEAGGFFFTPDDGEKLVFRHKFVLDGALPSGNSVAMLNLAKLARLTASPELEETAFKLAQAFSGEVATNPAVHTQYLSSLDFLLGPTREIVIAGSGNKAHAFISGLSPLFLPNSVTLFKDTGSPSKVLSELSPFTHDMTAARGEARAYLCEGNHCLEPIDDPDKLLRLLQDNP
jgi:uncharacterized protein YyaL (SSP411 family)